MIVQCTGCGTRYKISEERLPVSGVKVRCPKCKVVFGVHREAEKRPESLGEKLFGRDVVKRPLGERFSSAGGPGATLEKERTTEEARGRQGPDEGAVLEGQKRVEGEEELERPERAETVEAHEGEERKEAEKGQQSVEVPQREGIRRHEEEEMGEGRKEGQESREIAEEEQFGQKVQREEAMDRGDIEDIRWAGERQVEGEEPVAAVEQEEKESEETRTGPAAQPAEPVSAAQASEKDPRTLARALVSDILFYNREKRDKGLVEGKILAYLGKEIARSWEIYKERVGIESATGTDHFREAVNEILASGRKII